MGRVNDIKYVLEVMQPCIIGKLFWQQQICLCPCPAQLTQLTAIQFCSPLRVRQSRNDFFKPKFLPKNK